MSVRQDLGVIQNNDVTFHISLTDDGRPLDTTDLTVILYLKASETTSDVSATVFNVGGGLTVISAELGKIDWDLPHANTATPGIYWWRIDVLDNSMNRTTMILGTLTVTAA